MSALPTATGGFGEKPVITFPATDAPEGLQVEILVEGDGPEVGRADNIAVHSLGPSWGGTVFDNASARGATIDFPLGVGAVIGGWDQGLVGQKLGSRILLSIPSELGYGMRGVPQAGIPGGATLVFVVDLVDIA